MDKHPQNVIAAKPSLTADGGAMTQISYTHANYRGDIVLKTDDEGNIIYQASYDAFGNRTQEFGSTLDRQKHGSKDEEPTGLINMGRRYYDPKTGVFLTPDPLGRVDPNSGNNIAMPKEEWKINGRSVTEREYQQYDLRSEIDYTRNPFGLSVQDIQVRNKYEIAKITAQNVPQSRVHTVTTGSPNLYTYVNQNPWTYLDPEGLSTVKVTDTEGRVTILNNTTNEQLRETISKMDNQSIKKLEIAGHGSPRSMDTGVHKKEDQGISISGIDAKGKLTITFDDTGGNFTDFLKSKMAPNAQIKLAGCNTANTSKWMGPFSSKDNITNALSTQLPRVEVTGYSGFGLSNKLLGNNKGNSELKTIGFTRTYLNGEEK